MLDCSLKGNADLSIHNFQRLRNIAWGPLLFGLGVILIGVLVLAGWEFSIPVLQSLVPGFVSMKPNTAICFILLGAALALLGPSPVTPVRRILGCACAAIALAMIAAILGEFVFGWQPGVDEWLFTGPMDTVRTVAPGRMALPSMAAFFLAGLALLALDWKPRRFFRPAEWLGLLAFYLGIISTLAHFLTTEAFDGHFGFTPMALHTSLGLMLLCGGILSARKGGIAGYLRDTAINPVARRVYVTLAVSAILLATAGFATLFSAYDSAVRSQQVHHASLVSG